MKYNIDPQLLFCRNHSPQSAPTGRIAVMKMTRIFCNHSHKPVPAQKIQENSHATHEPAVPSAFTLNEAILYYENHFNHGFYVNGEQKSAGIRRALSELEDKS